MSDGSMQAASDEWLTGWLTGPVRNRWETLPVQVGDPAPSVRLGAAVGGEVELSSVWADGPALVLFWRHYGCSCGIERAGRLGEELPSYRDAGANVVVIGMGEPERARAYADRHGLDCTFLCDPDRVAYGTYGLLEGGPAQILFDAPDEFLRRDERAARDLQASRAGTERALVDDPWQLPGEFVVGPDGTLALTYRYQWCEDYPDPRVLVSSIRLAAGSV